MTDQGRFWNSHKPTIRKVVRVRMWACHIVIFSSQAEKSEKTAMIKDRTMVLLFV